MPTKYSLYNIVSFKFILLKQIDVDHYYFLTDIGL